MVFQITSVAHPDPDPFLSFLGAGSRSVPYSNEHNTIMAGFLDDKSTLDAISRVV
jgi:hypothetical protein